MLSTVISFVSIDHIRLFGLSPIPLWLVWMYHIRSSTVSLFVKRNCLHMYFQAAEG